MSSEDVVVLSFGEKECFHVVDQDIEWVLDTAASYHATPNKEFFTSYKAGDFGTVKMGNTSHSKIIGIGDVCIQTSVGCTLTMKDVRHVPDLRLNLISGIALDRQGYENYFGNGRWKLNMGSLVVTKGKACCTLYKTHAKVCKNELNAVEDSSSPNLWHKRLGHMSEKGLQIMAKKALILFAKDFEMTEKSKGVVDVVSNFTTIPSPLQHTIADGEVHEEIGSDDTQEMIDDEMSEHEVVEQGEQPTQQESSESQVRSGCLSDHIYEDELSTSKKKQLLSWESKLRIATEIADAVAYLHKGTSKIIIHRYINSRTIFLDQHYVANSVAKLFDLGFSVSIPLGETHVESDVVLGTFGFIAPESYSTGRFTEKSDVYNFGMVLIEILIGKRVFVILEEVCGVPVLDQVNSIFRWENDFSHLVHDNEKDFRLYLKANIVKGNKEQLMACTELAIKCIKVNPEERPSMMEAAKELRRIRRFQVDSL
ncbi:hypothetical protein HHK36_022271 [Tetracentron sinense]|uniref:Protein kinase domain-containing protein n=1 Tax=Tetracentron sinense TaxID=13715 RepID=A0A834YRM0_TETSI|nr:hypothetical protein HHK36_022271 [Tetracentron sinense]